MGSVVITVGDRHRQTNSRGREEKQEEDRWLAPEGTGSAGPDVLTMREVLSPLYQNRTEAEVA